MRTLLLAGTACLAIAASAASAQTFTFSTLDNPGDPTFNQLLGINDNGVIVGYFGSGAAGHPNIGYEIAPPYTSYMPNMQPGSVQTQATGINNADDTTGFWSTPIPAPMRISRSCGCRPGRISPMSVQSTRWRLP